MPTLTITTPPPGEDVIEVGIIIDGVEYGRTKDGRLVMMWVQTIELTAGEAAEVERRMKNNRWL